MRSPNENNRTRQGQQNNRRGRHNNNRRNNNNNSGGGNKPQNTLTRNFDSNGPDVKIRGNAQTVADKYTSLAQDAISSGSRIMAENYFQHAEHYKRIVSIAQEQVAEQKAAHQAKMDAQQAEQEAKRAEHEARRAEQRGQNSQSNNAQSDNTQPDNAQPDAEAPAIDTISDSAPSMNNNDNAPVNILADNEPNQPASEQPAAEEAKPKRKPRPKRKPSIAKTEPVEPATADDQPPAPTVTEETN
ncbi:MAG: DUF4167 domain-containing protein [Alphaproteobacteria bacterium]|nr:DUF4167 domain-containing protein [Alphaproteobacteria bacterium]